MTVITSQKGSGESTKVPSTKIVDASSVALGADSLYHHPTHVDINEYLYQRRHNRQFVNRCIVTWCGKLILAVSIAVMLFALIVLLLSWAEGYPSMEHRDFGEFRGSGLQRASNLERMEPPALPDDVSPIIPFAPRKFYPFPTTENQNKTSPFGNDEEPSYFSFDNAVRAMRERFQTVFRHMRDMLGNTDNLPAPSPNSNDTEVIRRITIDGTEFVQTRQVLKKPLPEGEGMIVVVRQQLIPVDQFYGNGTTVAALPSTTPETDSEVGSETTTDSNNAIDDDEP